MKSLFIFPFLLFTFNMLLSQENKSTGSEKSRLDSFLISGNFAIYTGISVLCNDFGLEGSESRSEFIRNWMGKGYEVIPEDMPFGKKELFLNSLSHPVGYIPGISSSKPESKIIKPMIGLSICKKSKYLHSVNFSAKSFIISGRLDNQTTNSLESKVKRKYLDYEFDYIFNSISKSKVKPFAGIRLSNTFIDYKLTYNADLPGDTGFRYRYNAEAELKVHSLQPVLGVRYANRILFCELGMDFNIISYGHGKQPYNYEYVNYSTGQRVSLGMGNGKNDLFYTDFSQNEIYLKIGFHPFGIINKTSRVKKDINRDNKEDQNKLITFFSNDNDILIFDNISNRLNYDFVVDYFPEKVPDFKQICWQSYKLPDNPNKVNIFSRNIELINIGASIRHKKIVHSVFYSQQNYEQKLSGIMLSSIYNKIDRKNINYEADYCFLSNKNDYFNFFLRLRLMNSMVDYLFKTDYTEDMMLSGKDARVNYDSHMTIHSLQPGLGVKSVKSLFNLELGLTFNTLSFAHGKMSYEYYYDILDQVQEYIMVTDKRFSTEYSDFCFFDFYIRLSISLGKILNN